MRRVLTIRLGSLQLDELERAFCVAVRLVTDDPEVAALIAGISVKEWQELCDRSDTVQVSEPAKSGG